MTLNYDLNAGYVLENERVLLRPLLESDYKNLLPYALNEPDTWIYSYRSARGEDGMRQYIKDALDNRAAGKDYAFIVYDKLSQCYAGSTRFYDILPNWQTVQLGYTWYGERFRGTGLNKHCKFLMLQFAFETLNALRVEFRADARNERSIAAMKSIGCVPEGILRNNMPLQEGGRRDSIVLSILKEEWENTVKDLIKSKMLR
ncbi:GNAT family N-acetyltransferase [Mucilaginibacter sp. L3T2-6]|uniref:GNAT family N-acetyltransferase n=1 Tax=Mucilaginibacter sp. L3T2-6 TaxID=3062491 RepID=UPI002675B967|nr:GNAT family protein [Mucilaginibacter sp. L3T2-6]MDO3640888.1 GNAT family protein [Mucilaginibacter sp. L3T2-6]MDV6213636.1 GNAT family protein [Mucilaginibacter sp. L3T2-6]